MADEKFSNFLTEIIDADLAEGKVKEIHTVFRRSRTVTCTLVPPRPLHQLHDRQNLWR